MMFNHAHLFVVKHMYFHILLYYLCKFLFSVSLFYCDFIITYITCMNALACVLCILCPQTTIHRRAREPHCVTLSFHVTLRLQVCGLFYLFSCGPLSTPPRHRKKINTQQLGFGNILPSCGLKYTFFCVPACKCLHVSKFVGFLSRKAGILKPRKETTVQKEEHR